ncbi:MAG TPA: hypothetical protein VJT31_24485 [Rugosimonospora sp.]|nr:hypothetical protein [Rugosimonospora sp.]
MTEPAVVWWLQAGSAYCDLRLPHDGVDQVMCFAGTTTWDGLRLTWHREVELDPSLWEDVGDVGWDGPDLIETGSVGSAGAEIGYVERWQRLPGSDHDLLALHCDGGRIVRTGRYALTILDGCQSGGDFAAVAWRLENDDWAARFSWPPDAVAPAPPADIPRKGETVVLRDGSEWIIDER